MMLDDKEQGSVSSPEPIQDDAPIETPAQEVEQEAQAEPSPAESEPPKAEKTVDIVRDVVAKSRKQQPDSQPGTDGPEKAPKQPKEPDNENYTDVPFSEHPRFKQLIRERNSFRDDAGRYRNVEQFLSNNGLVADEAAEALMIAGLAKMNPAEAFRRVLPWVQNLALAAGEIIPNDLMQRVQQGEMTPEVAREISRAQAFQRSTMYASQFNEQQRQRQVQEQHVANLMAAASSWEQERRIKDPNYSAKAEAVEDAVMVLQRREGMPSTPAGVTDMLQRAYKAVNERFRAPAPQARQTPQRPAVQPVRGGSVAGTTQAKPRNTLDIIRQVREASSR